MSDETYAPDEMKVSDLKAALRDRDLPETGKKSVLAERLSAALAEEAKAETTPVLRFNGLADNQFFKHEATRYSRGQEVPVDPDDLAEWQQQAVDAGVAIIDHIPASGG